MSDVWVAHCILEVAPGSRPFWGGTMTRVSVRMLLQADNASTFEIGIRASAKAGGAQVQAIEGIRRASEVVDPAMLAALPHANAAAPMMVEAPVAAPESVPAIGHERAWDEYRPAEDLWAIVDGVSWDDLPGTLASCAQQSACIYTTTDPGTLAAAPWLVHLNRAGGMFDLIAERPCDTHSVILLRSPLGLAALRKHLRRYTMLRVPGGDAMPKYFRYYDPRVMLDLCDAFEPGRLARFFDPLDAVIVPLSPECLMPTGTVIDTPPTIFTAPEACQGRCLEMRHTDATIGDMAAAYPVNPGEMSRFGLRASQRAHAVLARTIKEDYSPESDEGSCLQIAYAASAAGKKFGLKSTKQVEALAKCIALRGPNFWEQDRQAMRILTSRDMLSWQRKNALLEWLMRAPILTRATG